MSDSRLEKFIYAICSMDVSDLPVPLSRIEKLWNCLITGETPDFEPLSRNEKYLMAMLDRYDISNLPAPMSRGEKLLYKIAVGETDLSDVPGYLSRYEELLKYLIENGGISGGDFEYVLYTLNQSMYTLYTTAEKPVKSAILKGQTLVNLCKDSWWNGTLTNGYDITQQLKPNNKYILFVNSINNIANISLAKSDFIPIVYSTNNNDNYFIFTTSDSTSEITKVRILLSEDPSSEPHYEAILLEYQEGIENWNIPYFEGMQSVKMPVLTTTGKNLIDDISWESGRFDNNTGLELTDNSFMRYQKFIPVKPSTTYVLSNGLTDYKAIYEYDTQKTFIGLYQNASFPNRSVKFTTSSTTRYIRIWTKNTTISPTFQFEESSTTTTYEPHKSNILTVNEPIELRGIGSVQDTLDCLTGEVTERIGEIVLNENITGYHDTNYSVDGYSAFRVTLIANIPNGLRNVICDKVKYYPNINLNWKKQEEFFTVNGKLLYVRILSTKASNFEELRTFLSSSPITIQYPLETESIKTVDLTVVDQDNQPTQLGTFENVTHVSLEAENLVPEVEMEVATRISTELASANPLMDDISTEQQQLNETVNEQSNNVDATMIAATEIFEEIL